MVDNAKCIRRMKELIENAQKANLITPSEKAFAQYPPEGTWQKDENGKITAKEYNL